MEYFKNISTQDMTGVRPLSERKIVPNFVSLLELRSKVSDALIDAIGGGEHPEIIETLKMYLNKINGILRRKGYTGD